MALAGLATTGLTAFAGHQPMIRVPEEQLDRAGAMSVAGQELSQAEFPLAGALALVALACWGALLVTRGVVRRAVAVLAALATAGVLVVVAVGGFVQRDDARDDFVDQVGLTGAGGDRFTMELTAWFWVALAGSALALAAAVAAVRLAPWWPEMGSRYDAPAAQEPGSADAPAEERTNLDLWKSLDEGDDPTTGPVS
ncbi:Trp biosynthesis-associated membrane protein [Nocardioides sp. TF02-7]|uniref:Trp biosynthesis-associated membrane protein n=1 Tax=Nocardioides sp. TF02-7 TaxID=2917724 RepID=UPI001F060ABB|nr:Trp biosynthesis-associated membrane protein [Nocardioides sp. TF02-7]UMG94899.1 Trp biosynthesis-associated membrane protein [Nocardioides sp. TF02-7]